MKFSEIIKDYKTLEKFCLGKFWENEELFKTTVRDNIERYRKGRKTIVVKDKDGTPLAGVKVRATLKNHEFKHGAHLFLLDQFETDAENKEYRRFFSEYFNLGTIPFYWKELEPCEGKPRYSSDSENIYRRPSPDLCLDYCREKGIAAKIHCLFYDKFIPDWLPKTDAVKMKEYYEKRFAEIAEKYGNGIMYEVEVINELLQTHWWTTHSVISDTRDSLEWSFKLAEKYFPNDVLVINEGNYIHEIGEKTYRHPYYMLIDAALAKGVRIDKIGIQNHIWMGLDDSDVDEVFPPYFDPVRIMKGLDVISELGKPLEITEVQFPGFDNGEESENLQAEILRYLYPLWFSTKNLESVVYWNSIDDTAFVSPEWDENKLRSGLFRRNLTPKKSAKMLKKLFKEEWHTDALLITDENGRINFDGFYGDYEIRILTENESIHSVNHRKKTSVEEVVCV